MKVAEAPADVVAQDLPGLVRHLDTVLVLEEGNRFLGPIAVAPAVGEPPFVAHPPHRVLDQATLGQLLARVQHPEHELHRGVDGAARPALAPGQLLGLYVAGYPLGRIVIETMRTDESELILGQRLNVWTSIVVFLLGVWIFWFTGRRAREDRPVGEPESQDVG